ncbi:MAG: hypothetical protein HQL99_07870 [Magnetococcales bacterium]|nr:hypothetical protein [Magnetococcales bacterium]
MQNHLKNPAKKISNFSEPTRNATCGGGDDGDHFHTLTPGRIFSILFDNKESTDTGHTASLKKHHLIRHSNEVLKTTCQVVFFVPASRIPATKSVCLFMKRSTTKSREGRRSQRSGNDRIHRVS